MLPPADTGGAGEVMPDPQKRPSSFDWILAASNTGANNGSDGAAAVSEEGGTQGRRTSLERVGGMGGEQRSKHEDGKDAAVADRADHHVPGGLDGLDSVDVANVMLLAGLKSGNVPGGATARLSLKRRKQEQGGRGDTEDD